MIYIITGKRELGKTTLARYIAAKRSPQIVIDPRRDWPDGTTLRTYDALVALDAIERGQNAIITPRSADTWNELATGIDEYVEDKSRPLAIVFDEVAMYPQRLALFEFAFKCSDRRNVLIILTCHRPKDVSTDIRAILDYWLIFRTTMPHDLEAIADRTSEECARKVTTLEPRHFVTWDDTTHEEDRIVTVHRHPELWREPVPNGELVGEPVRRSSLW